MFAPTHPHLPLGLSLLDTIAYPSPPRQDLPRTLRNLLAADGAAVSSIDGVTACVEALLHCSGGRGACSGLSGFAGTVASVLSCGGCGVCRQAAVRASITTPPTSSPACSPVDLLRMERCMLFRLVERAVSLPPPPPPQHNHYTPLATSRHAASANEGSPFSGYSDEERAHITGFLEALGLAELTAVQSQTPPPAFFDSGRLSLGERQRVIAARLAFHAPRIAFIDEAFSGLDAAASLPRCLRVLQGVGTTLVAISHDDALRSGGEMNVRGNISDDGGVESNCAVGNTGAGGSGSTSFSPSVDALRHGGHVLDSSSGLFDAGAHTHPAAWTVIDLSQFSPLAGPQSSHVEGKVRSTPLSSNRHPNKQHAPPTCCVTLPEGTTLDSASSSSAPPASTTLPLLKTADSSAAATAIPRTAPTTTSVFDAVFRARLWRIVRMGYYAHAITSSTTSPSSTKRTSSRWNFWGCGSWGGGGAWGGGGVGRLWALTLCSISLAICLSRLTVAVAFLPGTVYDALLDGHPAAALRQFAVVLLWYTASAGMGAGARSLGRLASISWFTRVVARLGESDYLGDTPPPTPVIGVLFGRQGQQQQSQEQGQQLQYHQQQGQQQGQRKLHAAGIMTVVESHAHLGSGPSVGKWAAPGGGNDRAPGVGVSAMEDTSTAWGWRLSSPTIMRMSMLSQMHTGGGDTHGSSPDASAAAPSSPLLTSADDDAAAALSAGLLNPAVHRRRASLHGRPHQFGLGRGRAALPAAGGAHHRDRQRGGGAAVWARPAMRGLRVRGGRLPRSPGTDAPHPLRHSPAKRGGGPVQRGAHAPHCAGGGGGVLARGGRGEGASGRGAARRAGYRGAPRGRRAARAAP